MKRIQTSQLYKRACLVAENEELTNSISRQGLLQPIIVRPAAGEGNENYTIVAGNRFNACKALGWMEIPSRIVEADDNGKTSPDKSFRPRELREGTESGIGKEFRYSNLNPTT
ncbi:MAG: ParB N-terminal domain-containing protein [Nitrososphaeraceae archaeon]